MLYMYIYIYIYTYIYTCYEHVTEECNVWERRGDSEKRRVGEGGPVRQEVACSKERLVGLIMQLFNEKRLA